MELPPPFDSVADLEAWAEGRGVLLTLGEVPDGLTVIDLDRGRDAPKGAGAEVMRAVSAYADERGLRTSLTVTGGNEALEGYYGGIGYVADEETRDEETSDVVMVRASPAPVPTP